MLWLSIKINMLVSPILFAASVWFGVHDSIWMTTKKEGASRKSQWEFRFYHLSRIWSYSFAFLSFV